MLKVIFLLSQLKLKLNNITCRIVGRNNKIVICLSPILQIKGGQVDIEHETEFLIVQNNPILKIQIQLLINKDNKLGG